MKGLKSISVLLASAVLVLMAIGCAPAENTNTTTTTTTATPAATPDKEATIAEITRIENDWPRIIRERDGAAVRRLEADDVMIVYPDGTAGNKEQDVKDIESGTITYDSWDISDLKVNVFDNDAAVASFLITVTKGKLKAPDGRTQDISGKYRIIDTFARRSGQWQMVGSGATPLSRAAAAAASASPSPKGSPAATGSPAVRPSPTPRTSPIRRTSPPPPPEPTSTP